jgi:ribosome-binding protein aMBF1 (putative translation factor)
MERTMKNAESKMKTLTPAEDKRMKQLQDELELEKDEIIAMGRSFKAEHDAMLAEVMDGIREAKERDGLSLADLQQRTGIDKAQLSRLLNGDEKLINPSLSTLERVAAAVGRRLKLVLARR